VSFDAEVSQCPSPRHSQSQPRPSQRHPQQHLSVRLLPEACDPAPNLPRDPTAEFGAENEQCVDVPDMRLLYRVANCSSNYRLFSDTLPSDPGLRLQLVNAFFDRSYSLRCLGFLHKSSFLQALECESVVQDFGEPLLYVLCALGARYVPIP
jgi:hypothetical protein